MNVNEHETTLH